MDDRIAGGRTMRAAGFFGLRDVRLIDVPHPGSPAPDEVLIVGHSLGAAMAVEVAAQVMKDGWRDWI